MNLTDFLIVYLACGAPFGVYYFLQNRARTNLLWFKTVLNFLFWMPNAVLIVSRYRKNSDIFFNLGFGKPNFLDDRLEENLYLIQKQIEKFLPASRLKASIYDFRETIERYVGLSLAVEGEDSKIREQETEIYRVSNVKNIELAADCLKRRNRKRTLLHQIEARKDFLNLIKGLSGSYADTSELADSAIGLVKILKDHQAQEMLEKIFAETLQTEKFSSVQQLEINLWKPEKHKPLSARPISAQLQTITTTLKLHEKD